MTDDEGEITLAAGASAPFLLEIEEDGLYIARYGAVGVLGSVLRGAATVGEALDLVGFTPEPKPVILRDTLADPTILGGMPCYLLEGDVTKEEVRRGQVLASSGSLPPATTFRADVVFDERYERITQPPWHGICRYNFYIRRADFSGKLYLPIDKQRIDHGDRFLTTIALRKPAALEVGLRFGIDRLLGQGVITEVIS